MNFKAIITRVYRQKRRTKPLYKIKRYMTLLEVMIAMSLLSVLLVIIFGFFRELSFINEKTKETIKESFQRRYVESRLFYIFSHLVNENATKSKKYFHFFTTQDEASKFPSLVLSFDNGTVFETIWGGHVLGRLFVDHNKCLCFATWPLELGESRQGEDLSSYVKIEPLLNRVEGMQLQFFVAPDTQNEVVVEENDKASQPMNKGQWISQWDKEYKQMPAIVRIEITLDKGQKEFFAFVLPSSKHPLTFLPKI